MRRKSNNALARKSTPNVRDKSPRMSMKKSELERMANSYGIANIHGMTKEQLIENIKRYRVK
jgi:hypothetical protein